MKLYIVTVDWAYDNDKGTDVVLFTEKEHAKEQFNTEVRDAIEIFENNDGYAMEGDDTQFMVYEKGFYSRTHFTINYIEREFDKCTRIGIGGSAI